MPLNRRNIEENIVKAFMVASTVIVIGSMLAVLAVVLLKGGPALSIEMLTQTPNGGYYLGKEGGILNAIVGSLYMAGGATVLAFVIGLPTALYLNEYSRRSRFAGFTRRSLDVLWSVPSIIYGAFGYIVMVVMGIGASLLGGTLALMLLEIPIMTRAMDEVIKMVPAKLKEASYSLGSTKFETTIKVITRQALPGIVMAVMLAFGRAIGDAASVLFTAGYTDSIPTSLFDPAASLPLAVFFQLGTPFPEVQQRAYASAAILLVIVLLMSIGSRILTRRFTKYMIR